MLKQTFAKGVCSAYSHKKGLFIPCEINKPFGYIYADKCLLSVR